MDPIDRVSTVFVRYCSDVLHGMINVQTIVDACPTTNEAMVAVVDRGLLPSINTDNLRVVRTDIPRLLRCLERIDEIKTLARKVFAHNFSEEDKYYVFSQEISFSYAAKMTVSMGLRLAHFSNHPTNDEVVRAELSIAMNAPVLYPDCEPRKRVMVSTMRTTTKRLSRSVDLTCHETMPLTQIQPPSRPRLAKADRR